MFWHQAPFLRKPASSSQCDWLCSSKGDIQSLTDGGCIIKSCQAVRWGGSLGPTPESNALDDVPCVEAGLHNGVHQLVVVHLLLLCLALPSGQSVSCKPSQFESRSCSVVLGPVAILPSPRMSHLYALSHCKREPSAVN